MSNRDPPQQPAARHARTPAHPGAAMTVNGRVIPIPLPDPATLDREREVRLQTERNHDSVITQNALRQQKLLQLAREEGDATGYRRGWQGGVHWGLLSGSVCGAIAAALMGAIIVWARSL